MVVFGKEGNVEDRKIVESVLRKVGDTMSRVRLLEQRINVIDTSLSSTKEDILNYNKILGKRIEDMNKYVRDIEMRIDKLENMVKEIVKQLKTLATKTDFIELKELIEIYNPLKSKFVTREELNRILEERR